MCDSNTQSLIEQEIDQKVQQNVMFTAYDITIAVQETLKSQGSFDPSVHRHRHLKRDIHRAAGSAISTGQFQQTLRDVGAPTQAFVYHPIGSDSTTYMPIKRKDSLADGKAAVQPSSPHAINVPAQSTAVVDADDDANDAGDGSDVGRVADQRGTLAVPAFLLRQLGLKFNDKAYVLLRGDHLAVVSSPDNGEVPIASYTVDHGLNVRITHAVLRVPRAGQPDRDASYDFDLESNAVLVREHKES